MRNVAGVCAWGADQADPKELAAAINTLQTAAVVMARLASEIPAERRI